MNSKNFDQLISTLVTVICFCLNTSSYAQGPVTQISNAPQSPNIVADTVNISGLSKAQTDLIIKHINLLREDIKKGQTISESAQKNIEIIDNELSKIQREKFDSLPGDAKKWVYEMRALAEVYQERNSLIQASMEEFRRKQDEYRKNLSQQTVVKITDLFTKIFIAIDSRILALQEEKGLGISYKRESDFSLFIESKSTARPMSVGLIRFKNGSSVDIILIPGTMVRGIAQNPPTLQIIKVIDNQRSHGFSFKEKRRISGGTITFGGGPVSLVPSLEPPSAAKEPSFDDVTFDPHQEVFGEGHKQAFLSTFTRFIGYVLSKDAVLKPEHK